MKPKSMRLFDLFYLGAIALSIAATAIFFDRMTQAIAGEAALAGLSGNPGTLVWIGTGLSAGISLILWFLVSRLRSVIAKWVLVVLVGLGLFIAMPGLFAGMGEGNPTAFVNAAIHLLEVMAAFMLFRRDAKEWLAGSTGSHPGMVSETADELG